MMNRILILAGESSGDVIGAETMKALSKRTDCLFTGVGGPLMQNCGLETAFDMEDLSLIGISQVLPRIPKLLRHLNDLAQNIALHPPDMIVTIDVPDFSFRLHSRVRSMMKSLAIPHIHQVHIVAPTVWALRPGRAKKIAQYLDKILCLYDFEPPYFERVGLDAEFVGHPATAKGLSDYDPSTARHSFGFSAQQPVLCLAPGSRTHEIKALLPIYAEAIKMLHAELPDLGLVATVTRQQMQHVIDGCRGLPVKVQMVCGDEEQPRALAASTAALVTSGTMTLHVALSKTPMAVGYRVSSLTYFIAKRLSKEQKYIALPNILATEKNEPATVPEYIQASCTPQTLYEDLLPLLRKQESYFQQVAAFQELTKRLSTQTSFGDNLADGLISMLARQNP